MPAIYTHNTFAKKTYSNLDDSIKKSIKESIQLYELFSQSFDFFYYYNFLALKKGKKIRDFGHYCHNHKTKLYLTNIIEYISNNDLQNNSDILAYLYGSINHYVLDTTFHPYINYKAGKYTNKQTRKYRGQHSKLEFNIDAYYYELVNNKPYYKFDIHKEILLPQKFSDLLINCLNEVYKKTYNVDNMGRIYEKSYNQGRLVFRLFMKDRFGIKKFIYKILDYLPIKKDFKFSSCSFHIKPTIDFLNENKKDWCHPCNKDYVFNSSWYDLANIVNKKTVKLITACHNYFNNRITKEKLLDMFENISYSSGLTIGEKWSFKYFEN